MANFPTSKDDATSLPNPTGTNTQNNPDHAGLHAAENAAIIALETKLGTGSTAPTANTLLFGTGAGTTAWQGLTSAQLASVLSDETGSGSAVFANTPTLITPKVDTINENTLSNGVTVGGVNLKAGVVTGSGAGLTSATVPGAALTNSSVTASKLATGAQTSYVVTSETYTSAAYGSLTTAQSVTVTIGANGLALLLVSLEAVNGGANADLISYAVSGATTVAASDTNIIARVDGTNEVKAGGHRLLTGLATGSTTFTLQVRVTGGTGTFERRSITAIPL